MTAFGMPLPKLSQSQSRFAVSLSATVLILLIYLSIGRPSFAYASKIDGTIPASADEKTPTSTDDLGLIPLLHEENDHLRLEVLPTEELPVALSDGEDAPFEAPLQEDVGKKMKRAPEGVSALANNAPQNMNIEPGTTENWVFPKEAIQGPHGQKGIGFPSDVSVTGNMSDQGPFRRETKRQSSTPIWITINTCLQPTSDSDSAATPPQLELYYSGSPENEKPGPSTGGTRVQVLGGYGIIETTASQDVYIGVSAPNITGFTGSWNYEIAASNDAPYHFWSNETDLLFVDGDNHAALLVTPDLSNASSDSATYQAWLDMQPPYGMFAHDQKNTSILGLSRSYCGLRHNAKIMANIPNVENNNVATMTRRGIGGFPKEQFYVSALNASSSYWGFLAMTGNSTHSGLNVIGGGGRVWTNMTFSTKASDNCALMYNLSFCSEVAYAVPSNPDKYSPLDGLSNLAAVYDSYAGEMYQNFNYSLQQIPCNTTASAQYSLARNCDDCARAYKQWLCAVTIPRCEDWDNTAPYLAPRNMAQNFTNGSVPAWISTPDPAQQILMSSTASNSSRNPEIIDGVIGPGPYKEVLPCIDLCYDLVQSCPAALGFGCPEGKYQNMSYGVRDQNPGIISCSYLGAAYYLSEGYSTRVRTIVDVGVAGSVALATTLALLIL